MLTCSVIDRSALDGNSPTHAHSMTLEHKNKTQFNNFSLQTVEDSSISPMRRGKSNLDNTGHSEGSNSLDIKKDSKCILF
jgi:hypothetical protein